MTDRVAVGVCGPLARYAAGYRNMLVSYGFAPRTVRLHLCLMADLSGWLAAEELDCAGLTPVSADRYLAVRRAAGYRCHCSRRALAPLLGYLRGQGIVQRPPEPWESSTVLDRYARYLRCERGLARETIARNVELVRPFLAGFEVDAEIVWGRLDSAAVTAFVITYCSGRRTGSSAAMMTALRSLLRFLHVEGLIDGPLHNAVPTVAARKLTGLPKALSAAQVTGLLDSCDTATVAGRRDRAVITVLARLGLRAGELAGLRVGDIDWRRGEITVRGKGNRSQRLPLPADVGQAIVDYLIAERPATTSAGEVFATVRAPHGPLSRLAVTQVVARAADRAGMPGPVHAHRLRHTAATEILRAGGSLTEIGQLLRHRRPATTAVYAKVDIEALRELALPWPGGAA